MKFLEKDLERIIWESDNSFLEYRGLSITGKKFRQVKIGNYGIADLITISRSYEESRLYITIYELKKEKIGISALLQAIGYKRGIERYFETKRNLFIGNDFNIKIVLIGSEIDTSGNFCYLSNEENIDFYYYEYEIDGITFNFEFGYHLINEGF